MQTWVFTKATCLKNVSPLLQLGCTLVWIKGSVEFSIAPQWWWFGTAAAAAAVIAGVVRKVAQSEWNCSEQKTNMKRLHIVLVVACILIFFLSFCISLKKGTVKNVWCCASSSNWLQEVLSGMAVCEHTNSADLSPLSNYQTIKFCWHFLLINTIHCFLYLSVLKKQCSRKSNPMHAFY